MKHIKQVLSAFLACCLACSLVACGVGTPQSQESSATNTKAFQPYTFVDDLGHEITIDKELTAVVPSGVLTQVMLMGIAPDLIAGLGGKLQKNMAPYLPEFERLSKLNYFGTVLGAADLDVEALASTNAQLVIDMGYAKSGYEEKLAKTQELTGIRCVYIKAELNNYGEAIRKLGTLLGRQDKAEKMAAWCEKVYDRAVKIMDRVGDKKVKALYAAGDGGLDVIAKGQSQAEVLNLVCDNVAVIDNPSGKSTGNTVSMEQIALWNPDFVIFGSGSVYDTAAQDPAWKQVSAIAQGKYVESPQDPYNWTVAPPACQRYLALLWLPSILYPEYCDYDLKEEVKEYYKLFYGVDLSDKQYEDLTKNAFLK